MISEKIMDLVESYWDIDIPWVYEFVFKVILCLLVAITLPLDILLMPIELIIYKIMRRIK